MLKYHIILNACAADFAKQAREINGFIRENGSGTMRPGYTFIICDREQNGDDKKRLADLSPTSSVIFVIQDYYEPEAVLDILAALAEPEALYLFGSNYSGWELCVRLGQRTGGSSLQGCLGLRVDEQGRGLLADKMAYSNHMKGTWLLNAVPYCVGIGKGQTEAETSAGYHQVVQEIDAKAWLHEMRQNEEKRQGSKIEWSERHHSSAAVRRNFEPYEESGTLGDAPFVMVAGRGIQNKEAAAELSEQAKRMGAAFGVTRPVAMNAWVTMEKLVGVSGAMLKPDICVAVGLSGAPALYAGIEKSRFIVAVNADERAPIMKKADVAIVGDGRAVAAELALLIERGGADERTADFSHGRTV